MAEVAERPRLSRDPAEGLVGGVLAGVAARLGIDPVLVRVIFIAGVIVTGGALLIAYGCAWVLMPSASGRSPVALPHGFTIGHGWRLGAGVGLLMLAVLLAFREIGLWWSDPLVWPLVLLSAGIAVLWGQSRSSDPLAPPAEDEPPRPARYAAADPAPAETPVTPARTSPAALYRGGFGVALVVGAALLFLSTHDALGPARDAAFTAIVAIVALALILAPFIWRLGRNLAAERAERIRSQERAELAAHLHDSVLQTLTLMQKRADDPREVAALARRQERELRSWLAGGAQRRGEDGFAAALRAAAEEVEDERRVKIDVVAVGDCPLEGAAAAIVAAAREALVNAAKFAGGEPISVYAEVTPERIEAFVRDRGPGFDPDEVPGDRRGLRESIIGRMQRNGGAARIEHVPGAGTEVTLTVERSGE
jgi:phage shock protein PspC (stress-responsive transcriptional regulator)/anti-sigma regulatory factor (Ser/Thr protein kinase)